MTEHTVRLEVDVVPTGVRGKVIIRARNAGPVIATPDEAAKILRQAADQIIEQERAETVAQQVVEAHELEIEFSPKMDAGSLVRAVCSCGRYRSTTTTDPEARKAHRQHLFSEARKIADHLHAKFWAAPEAGSNPKRPA